MTFGGGRDCIPEIILLETLCLKSLPISWHDRVDGRGLSSDCLRTTKTPVCSIDPAQEDRMCAHDGVEVMKRNKEQELAAASGRSGAAHFQIFTPFLPTSNLNDANLITMVTARVAKCL